jgi:hypothetical protein
MEGSRKILFYNPPEEITEAYLRSRTMNDLQITTDEKCFGEAAAVIFYMPGMEEGNGILHPAMKREGQLWVFWSNEPEIYYKWQYEPEVYNLFDITATYKLDADVPIPYFYPYYFGALRSVPVPRSGFACALIPHRSDNSYGADYLRELRTYIQVDCYDQGLAAGALEKYKFTIAFECAVSKDYVTGIFFEPLLAGSVPVYLGAPNVEEFAPGDHCYIDGHSFPGARALADHLTQLNNDPTGYASYLAWKTKPYRRSFNLKANFVGKHPLVSLCHLIRSKVNKYEGAL